ncbi:putative ribonuclease H-like domain-containing protein [Tanacetum coccineum]
MKDIFKDLAEDDQNVKCYIATNSELTVSRFTEMHKAHTIVQTRCLELEAELSKLRDKTRSEADRTLDFRTLDFQITQLTEKVSVLQEQNELFRAENEKVKQHYKELYDSIKITRAKHIEQTTALLTENENLKAQIHENLKCNTIESVKPRVLAPGRYAIDVEPIPPHNRNNREVHLYYLKHLKESVETLREIVEEAKVERPLDRSIISACRYTKHSQELLEYAIGTCPKAFNQRDKKACLPTPFVNKDLTAYYERVGIFHQKTVPRTPQQNDVVERQNRTLVEAARIMLIFSKAMMFLWAEAVLLPTNDNEDHRKLQPTTGIGIFIGYAPSRKGPVSPAPAISVSVTSAGTPSSTTIDQDAPSPSHSQSYSALQSPSLHQGIAAESTLMEDNHFPPVDYDPFVNVFALEPSSEA